jgi:hypothetical protein
MLFNVQTCWCGQRVIAIGLCRDHYLDAFTPSGNPEWANIKTARERWKVELERTKDKTAKSANEYGKLYDRPEEHY